MKPWWQECISDSGRMTEDWARPKNLEKMLHRLGVSSEQTDIKMFRQHQSRCLLTWCSQIPLPSPGCGGRFPGAPGTVPAGCAAPCSPLAQELPLPLPEQPAVHPSQPPGASWPSRSHGCCGHPHQSGPEGLWLHLKVRVHLVEHSKLSSKEVVKDRLQSFSFYLRDFSFLTGVAEDSSLLGCYTVLTSKELLTFQKA